MGASATPILQTMRGRIVDLRRQTNVHLYWRGRFGPAERYELWLRDAAGREHQFTIHTRILPARRGHEVTLLIDALAVRAIVNWSTGMSVNYLRVDPPPLLRLRDPWVPPALLIALASWLGDVGLLILPLAALLYLLAAAMVRYVIRHRRAAVNRVFPAAQMKTHPPAFFARRFHQQVEAVPVAYLVWAVPWRKSNNLLISQGNGESRHFAGISFG
jgi:hypothetical protein